ncbi:MAG: sulfatase [Opitutaceae bacterium]|nr:sulfatase [Opitutaceae bacterium]
MKTSIAALACLLLLSPGAAKAAPPNIIFILIDDMGAADGGCFGSRYYQTPNLDQLAADGVKFTRAYASCAVCSPSRAAILTGKAPARLHLTDWIPGEKEPAGSRLLLPAWQKSLPLSEVTLAEVLKAHGYATASIGKWHLGGGHSPRDYGFDINIGGGDTGQPASYFWPYGRKGQAHEVPGLAERGGSPGEYLTDRLTNEALRFIEDHRTRPFFLYLPHYAVHGPLMGKPEDIENASKHAPADGQGNAVYAAMLRSVDDSVGRLRQKLRDLHLEENTIVVFTSDNGGAVHFGNPPATANGALRLGKGYPYEGGLRVPLLMWAPGVKRGTVCDTPVISHDFLPTLLELAGLPPVSHAIDGMSFASVLRGHSDLSRDALFWHYPHYWFGGKVSPYSVAHVGDWKLIRFYEDNHEELYNLRDDPSEKEDLARTHSEKRRALGTRLDRWLKDVGAQMNPPR